MPSGSECVKEDLPVALTKKQQAQANLAAKKAGNKGKGAALAKKVREEIAAAAALKAAVAAAKHAEEEAATAAVLEEAKMASEQAAAAAVTQVLVEEVLPAQLPQT